MNNQIKNIYLNHHHTYPLKENLRFELAYGDSSDYRVLIENGKVRAHTLFNEVFKETEVIQLIFFMDESAGKNKISKYFYNQAFKIVDSFTTSAWGGYHEGTTTALVVETRIDNLKKSKTIDSTFYMDFFEYGKLKIKSNFVFYNAKDNIILNIYDDRGCDIWSDNITRQKVLYQKYHSWVLDYDKENINKNLKAFSD